jgi:signal transduction histidine kinase
MRPGSLLRSSAFRLAIAFGVLFITAFLVSVLVTYQSVRADLTERLDRSVEETYSVIVASYGTGDLEDLVASVDTHTRIARSEERFVTLFGPGGTHLAGTIVQLVPPVGWSTIPAAALGLPGDEPFRVYSGQFEDKRLAVAMSFSETDELLEIAMTSFGWGIVFVVIGVGVGSAFLASRIQRRMDAIAGTMMKVSHGELQSRIPLIGNDDDIDRLSAQINAALERLGALVEGMRQVSTDIAHDLKTPLNRLSLVVETAIEKEAMGTSVTKELAEARNESYQINATFDALLRIAQIESGARKSRFTMLILDDILKSITETYVDVAIDSGFRLEYHGIVAGSTPIHGDRELLLQLFSNLVENAIRHCPIGTAISLTLEETASTIIAAVRDNGPGIPEGERENVLRRLYRLDKSRTTPGTGLGLSLVKAIAELHGATVALNDCQPGLKVTITFPKYPRF